jgi:hypothetical protein
MEINEPERWTVHALQYKNENSFKKKERRTTCAMAQTQRYEMVGMGDGR